MFGFFRKKKPTIEPLAERVFLSSAARTQALAKACRVSSPRGRVALVMPFRDHLPGQQEALRLLGVEVALPGGSYRSAAPQDMEDAVPLMDQATFCVLAGSLWPGQPLDVFLVERHPLRAHDDDVGAALSKRQPAGRLLVYHSMEDGLFELFGARLSGLVEQLDMSPDEPIEHAMVSASLARAQDRLRERVPDEIPADSFAAWKARNLKSTP